MPWSYFFGCWVLSQLFHFPLSPLSRGSLFPLHFLSLKLCHLHISGCCYFSWKSWFQLMIHPAWHFAWCTLHIDYAKAFDCVDHNKLWEILKEMGIPDHLNCLLRNLYAGQEATVRTGHGATDWFQIGKGVHQGCILSPCLFNLYAEHIMRKRWAGRSTRWNQDCQEKHQ